MDRHSGGSSLRSIFTACLVCSRWKTDSERALLSFMDGVVHHGKSLALAPIVVVPKRTILSGRGMRSGAKANNQGVRENIVISLTTCDSDREITIFW
jgi:hypothetical protein